MASCSASIVSSHSAGPQSPSHSMNSEPGSGSTRRVSSVPSGYWSSQSSAGPVSTSHWIVPEPLPAVSTESANSSTWASKVTVTLRASSIVSSHSRGPQSPENSTNSEPGSGSATRLSSVPSSYSEAQGSASPPSTLPSAVPVPLPSGTMVKGNSAAAAWLAGAKRKPAMRAQRSKRKPENDRPGLLAARFESKLAGDTSV